MYCIVIHNIMIYINTGDIDDADVQGFAGGRRREREGVGTDN